MAKQAQRPAMQELKDTQTKRLLLASLTAGRKAVQVAVSERKKTQASTANLSSFRF